MRTLFEFYDYGSPDEAWNIVAAVIFAIILLAQIILGFVSRRPILLYMWVAAGALEVTGYAARALAPKLIDYRGDSSYVEGSYREIQFGCLLFGPLCLLAGHSDLLLQTGKNRRSLMAALYMAVIFAACCVMFGLTIHLIDSDFNNLSGPICLIVGLSLQVSSIIVCVLAFWESFVLARRSRTPMLVPWQWLLSSVVSLLLQLARLLYHIVVIAADIEETEIGYMMADWLMVMLGMIAVTLVYPAELPFLSRLKAHVGFPTKFRGKSKHQASDDKTNILLPNASHEMIRIENEAEF